MATTLHSTIRRALLAFVAVGLGLTFVGTRRGHGPAPLPVLGTVTGFQFTNQLGQLVSTGELRGSVWLADVIFTRCPGPCLRMTRQMAALQAALAPADPVKLVSLTADPEFDTPSVLRAYGARFQAQAGRWHFLTGRRTEINAVATKQLLLAVADTDPAQRTSEDDLFIHSTKLVLVDREGRLRAVYEGTAEGVGPEILEAIRRLLREG